ncbi:MAG: methyltransferase domain-containing protein [Ignavibacteria bacterium]|nr:methyltransferase domain-containing protein [Ignavibacteria bacterium]
MLKRLFDNTRSTSLANSFRRKRLKLFLELADKYEKPVRVLDVGGTENYWKQMGLLGNPDYEITITNIEDTPRKVNPQYNYVKADASMLDVFGDKSFDIVFSNSMIEHIPNPAKRQQAAGEIARIGRSYLVQTPAYWIAIEPHFLFPFFQLLPRFLKLFLARNFNLGWFKKCSSSVEAAELIDSIRLLKKQELSRLFPDSLIHTERVLALPKSYLAIKQ